MLYIQNVKYLKPTFNLPNISDCFIQGGTPGTTNSAGLPNIIGHAGWTVGSNGNSKNNSGAFTVEFGGSAKASQSSGSGNISLNFDASISNSIYGNSTTVQPKSVEMKYCIKY